jgi:hypothetical protein
MVELAQARTPTTLSLRYQVTEWDGYGTSLDKAEALARGLCLSVSQLGPKGARLERVAFRDRTLQGRSCRAGIANFKSDPSCVKVAILERVASFAFPLAFYSHAAHRLQLCRRTLAFAIRIIPSSRTESAHLHVVSGVRSCYTVKPSALQKSDEPMWQSRKKSSLDESYPSTTPDMVDVAAAAHLAVQPSIKLCTIRQSLRAPRASRQHAPTS